MSTGLARKAWLAFTIVMLLSFAALETVGVVSAEAGDTYTESIRAWLGIDPYQPHRRWGALGFGAGLAVFTVWFIVHITHWPRRWPWEKPLGESA